MTVREEVRERIERDALLAKLRKKIDSGKATYADTAAYSVRAGKLLGEIFSRRLPDIPLEEREALCVELLRDRYTDINALCNRVQKALDEAQGLHLAPQHAPFNGERGHQIGSSLRDLSKPMEVLQRRAKAATETMTKAMHDDRMKSEAKFRSRAGLKCTVNRIAAAKCCEWCDQVAGKYAYEDTPPDLWRRHDNCNCTIVYGTRRDRQVLRGTEKKWEIVAEGVGAPEPVRLTPEQARKLQEKHQLSYLTGGVKSGTMKSSGTGADEGQHWFEQITTIDPSDKKAAAQLLRDFERQYADSPIEHCRVVTAAGEVYDVHGGRWTVDTTLLGEKMRGSTNEHNHVTGESQYSFSWEDLKSSVEDGSKVAIAFDEKYRYTMIFPDYQLDDDTVYAAYQAAYESVGDDLIFYPEKIAKGDEQHEAIKRACKTLGIQYGRTSISG